MSLDLTPVREQIVSTLKSVRDIGVVHAFEPLATSLEGLKRYYVAPGLRGLRGWFVRRVSTQELGQVYERGIEYTTWQIQGYMAVADDGASALVAQALVEDVREAFRANPTLGDLVASLAGPSQRGEIHVQLREFATVMFCDVLCHGIRLELSTERYLTVEEP